MIELNGKYNKAKVFTDNIEQTATNQIIELCNQEFIKDSKIRIMPDCLTEDTEILTDKGFKFIKELKNTDKIANYLINGDIFFKEPKQIINRPKRDGELVFKYYNKQNNFEFTVSENHRMAIKNNMGIKAKEIKTILFKNMIFSSNWNNDGINKYKDEDIQLICWIVADGSVHITHNEKSDCLRIRFGIKKDRKINRILELLNKVNIKYYYSKTDKQTSIYVNSRDSEKYIKLLGENKTFPKDFLYINRHQREVFFEEIIKTDGDYESYINGRGYRYNDSKKENIDIISALCSLSGRYSKINYKEKTTTYGTSKLYYINIIDKNKFVYSKSGVHNRQIRREIINYSGNLVCVECDSSFFIARQKGLTFITGNCHAGAGCTIGTTMTIKNKVVPNLVGVDLGCFVGETKIPLLNGTQKTIKELSELSEHFYVYSVNKKGEITYGIASAFKTRTNADLVKVTISGGSEIICTPDHKFMNRDGSYTEAKDLKYLDSLMPLYRTYQTRDGYESIIQPNNKKLPLNTHKLIAKAFYGEIPKGMAVHHKDDNKFNNCPENLQILSAQEHSKIHGKSLKVSKRLKSEEFKTNRKEKLEINGYYNENLYEKKKEVGIINITNYMKNNKEHFEKVVEANAKRGSKFFNNKNSDEVMITKQKLGRLRKILLNIINNNEEVNEETYEKYRKDYYNYPKYNKYLELIKELGLSTEDIINKKYDKAFNNHKVISVELLDYKEDVYCLNVEEHHNFALTAGVFVHNCGMLTVKLKDKEIDFQKLDYIIRQHIPNGQNVRQTYHKNNSKIDLQELRCKGKLNIDRAMKSLGTLGGGNHFTEINKDSKGNLYLVIHSGSRYLGKQVAEYYQDLAFKTLSENVQDKSKLIDKLKSEGKANLIQQELKKIKPLKVNRQLAYLEGDNFNDYLHDIGIVQKYANINRETMAEEIVKHMGFIVDSSFSTIHNYIDLENMILRKGAISSQKGEVVLIPMNMRDGSLLCIGKGNEDWNYSAPHGAGRILSRSKAKEKITLDEFKDSMNGIWTSSVCESTIDESPMTYKPMQEIIDNIGDTVEIIDILKPLYNFKSSS